jgi:hypothetical protein
MGTTFRSNAFDSDILADESAFVNTKYSQILFFVNFA